MDILERTSLYATCLTLYLSLFYMVDGISNGVKITISLLMVLGNAGVVVYFCLNILREFIFGTVKKVDYKKKQMIEEKFGKYGKHLIKFFDTARTMRKKVFG